MSLFPSKQFSENIQLNDWSKCKKLKVPEVLKGLMLPQPYTPFPEEGASQRIHPFPQSLVSVTDPAAQMSWGKHPPQRVPASLWTILNMMTKQNSKWKQYTKFHSQLFSKYDTDYR